MQYLFGSSKNQQKQILESPTVNSIISTIITQSPQGKAEHFTQLQNIVRPTSEISFSQGLENFLGLNQPPASQDVSFGNIFGGQQSQVMSQLPKDVTEEQNQKKIKTAAFVRYALSKLEQFDPNQLSAEQQIQFFVWLQNVFFSPGIINLSILFYGLKQFIKNEYFGDISDLQEKFNLENVNVNQKSQIEATVQLSQLNDITYPIVQHKLLQCFSRNFDGNEERFKALFDSNNFYYQIEPVELLVQAQKLNLNQNLLSSRKSEKNYDDELVSANKQDFSVFFQSSKSSNENTDKKENFFEKEAKKPFLKIAFQKYILKKIGIEKESSLLNLGSKETLQSIWEVVDPANNYKSLFDNESQRNEIAQQFRAEAVLKFVELNIDNVLTKVADSEFPKSLSENEEKSLLAFFAANDEASFIKALTEFKQKCGKEFGINSLNLVGLEITPDQIQNFKGLMVQKVLSFKLSYVSLNNDSKILEFCKKFQAFFNELKALLYLNQEQINEKWKSFLTTNLPLLGISFSPSVQDLQTQLEWYSDNLPTNVLKYIAGLAELVFKTLITPESLKISPTHDAFSALNQFILQYGKNVLADKRVEEQRKEEQRKELDRVREAAAEEVRRRGLAPDSLRAEREKRAEEKRKTDEKAKEDTREREAEQRHQELAAKLKALTVQLGFPETFEFQHFFHADVMAMSKEFIQQYHQYLLNDDFKLGIEKLKFTTDMFSADTVALVLKLFEMAQVPDTTSLSPIEKIEKEDQHRQNYARQLNAVNEKLSFAKGIDFLSTGLPFKDLRTTGTDESLENVGLRIFAQYRKELSNHLLSNIEALDLDINKEHPAYKALSDLIAISELSSNDECLEKLGKALNALNEKLGFAQGVDFTKANFSLVQLESFRVKIVERYADDKFKLVLQTSPAYSAFQYFTAPGFGGMVAASLSTDEYKSACAAFDFPEIIKNVSRIVNERAKARAGDIQDILSKVELNAPFRNYYSEKMQKTDAEFPKPKKIALTHRLFELGLDQIQEKETKKNALAKVFCVISKFVRDIESFREAQKKHSLPAPVAPSLNLNLFAIAPPDNNAINKIFGENFFNREQAGLLSLISNVNTDFARISFHFAALEFYLQEKPEDPNVKALMSLPKKNKNEVRKLIFEFVKSQEGWIGDGADQLPVKTLEAWFNDKQHFFADEFISSFIKNVDRKLKYEQQSKVQLHASQGQGLYFVDKIIDKYKTSPIGNAAIAREGVKEIFGTEDGYSVNVVHEPLVPNPPPPPLVPVVGDYPVNFHIEKIQSEKNLSFLNFILPQADSQENLKFVPDDDVDANAKIIKTKKRQEFLKTAYIKMFEPLVSYINENPIPSRALRITLDLKTKEEQDAMAHALNTNELKVIRGIVNSSQPKKTNNFMKGMPKTGTPASESLSAEPHGGVNIVPR